MTRKQNSDLVGYTEDILRGTCVEELLLPDGKRVAVVRPRRSAKYLSLFDTVMDPDPNSISIPSFKSNDSKFMDMMRADEVITMATGPGGGGDAGGDTAAWDFDQVAQMQEAMLQHGFIVPVTRDTASRDAGGGTAAWDFAQVTQMQEAIRQHGFAFL